ncbi:SpoIIE family protein phosphatase [candidate division KSB1 bacterium]
MEKEIDKIINIFKYAIKAEIAAFTGYYEGSKRVNIPEVKGILLYLAEEERKHKTLLLDEYFKITNYGKASSKKATKAKKEINKYKIPKKYSFKNLKTLSGIDTAGITLPMEIVSGDYLDTFTIADANGENQKLVFILFDTMGHGLSATYIKSTTRAAFQSYAEKLRNTRKGGFTISPAYIVSEINKQIAKKCLKHGSFVTLFLGVIDLIKNELVYTSAGHEPPICICDITDSVDELLRTQLILGFDESTRYKENKIVINPDNTFVLFSDGIPEATNSNDEMFGRKKIIDTILKYKKSSSTEILNQIILKLKEHIGRKYIYDDISLLVLKIKNKPE